jgi:transcription-repair coupling factor (superfamily II helicase)
VDITEGNIVPGLEYYLPLFFEKTSHLFEYLPQNTLVIQLENVEKFSQTFWDQVKERYEQRRHDRFRSILEPKEIFLQPSEVFAQIKLFPRMQLFKDPVEQKQGYENFLVSPLPALFIEAREENSLKHLLDFLANFKGRVLFCAESTGRREILKELFVPCGCKPVEVAGWHEFLQSDIFCGIVIAPLEAGFLLENKIAVITETELFGKRVMQRRLRKVRKQTFDMEVQNLVELTIGAPVVHIEHGIGRYLGLTKLALSEQEAEFVTLEYAGGDKLYVPVASLHLINRYSGVDLEHAPINRLGSDHWQRAKRKAIEQACDVAAELLEIYAKRATKKGFAFPTPDQHYEAFCMGFPFEETPDQKRAIDQVIEDLTSSKPMDRMVCGDVGFGKTEVALRATFLAIQANKQVAILVPTTLLAEQHFQTFSDRFSNFPVRVEVMSRFRTPQEQKTICRRTEEGKIDILIGTHKILQNNIQFKSLGLLIIDEEHRFGVRQKEAVKALRTEVDILTLTATPIPRTLNMAMVGLRDLSIIATPPERRLSIKTFVRERDPSLVCEAILRELYRGGQVYFLHNSVETIEREAHELTCLIPTARIAIAHGQMRERELEQVMSDFYRRRYNVLVCTTIIETGIDIPTANTIIIDRADKFGLAQLHQLRGRVGRSHHQAYAFCLIPPKVKISTDAVKRLEAIVSMEELGAGFTLATHDLEIRGAGELLGEAQSGNIQSIGFHLYLELLGQAVNSLKEGQDLDSGLFLKKGIEIDLQIPALIPESYVSDVHSRLILYKRISSAKQPTALEDLWVEMTDRFGLLPMQTQNLFKMAHLKLQAEALGICKVEVNAKGGRFEFILKPKIDLDRIIELIQKNPLLYKLEGPQKLRFRLDLTDPKTRIEKVTELMKSLTLR